MVKLHDLFSGKSGSSQRPLRVGEEVRHVISNILLRGDFRAAGLLTTPITVAEVKVSPDLKNASVFVMPLGGKDKLENLETLKDSAPEIRHLVSKQVKLRYVPKLHFLLDNSFEEAERINSLLKKPEVARDLESREE
ncbi:MAG: 30S ribosome-binding factor RbfA [Rickettsiales bacterium]